MLRPIQDPVPGMWLSISHVNRSFSCWISHYVSFLLLPYYRFLSWKLYPSDIKTNLSSSILLDDAANTQTKRMDILKEIHCSQTTATKKPKHSKRCQSRPCEGPRAPKTRLCPLCPLSVWDLPVCCPMKNTNSGASDPVQNFWLW